jgi:hypothetical protein
MTRALKVLLFVMGLILIVAVVFLLPYKARSVPEWKVQVVDENQLPVPGVQANEEWIDPIEDGVISSDSRNTDANGWVVFPIRRTHNRLAFRAFGHTPSAHIFACWQEKVGDVFWEENYQQPTPRLVLRKGSCPYG